MVVDVDQVARAAVRCMVSCNTQGTAQLGRDTVQLDTAHVGHVDDRPCTDGCGVLGAGCGAPTVAIWLLPCAPGLQLAAAQRPVCEVESSRQGVKRVRPAG